MNTDFASLSFSVPTNSPVPTHAASAGSESAVVPSDKTRVMNAIRAIMRASRATTRALELRFGTSLAQLLVLQRLSEGEATSVKELAARTMTHDSSTSVVVRRLVDRGFVRRVTAPDDRRRVGFAITEEGRAFLAKAPGSLESRLLAGLQEMAPADRAQLTELLETLMERADIVMESAEPMDQAS